jgi:hypothetical protein
MRLDFTPVLLASVLLFVVVAVFQFSNGIAAGERGLVLFERSCPIHSNVLPGPPLL